MASRKFEFALEQLPGSDWLAFEELAREFLSPEFPSLRTTAAVGDRGRDGQLYQPEEEPSFMFQYSTEKNWKAKISRTIKKLSTEFPSVKTLVYLSNQVIGPAGDEIKLSAVTDYRVFLDIRDRSWFTEREATHPARSIAAAEFIARFADPILHGRGLIDHVAPALESDTARVALLQLALEHEDAATDRNLTKEAFDALVRMALAGSHVTKTLDAQTVVARVQGALASADARTVAVQVQSALNRLSRPGGPVNLIQSSGHYHLARHEQIRLEEREADFLLHANRLKGEIAEVVQQSLDVTVDDSLLDALSSALRQALEAVLLKKGEIFAAAVQSGEIAVLTSNDILQVVGGVDAGRGFRLSPEQATSVVITLLRNPPKALRAHLRRLADAYTLFAFLQETPDVQRALITVFQGGEFWLDTTVVLPLLAETLLESDEDREMTNLLRATRDSGIRLYVTNGVLEETERHLNRSLACSRNSYAQWTGRIPFLFRAYTESGGSRGAFPAWLETFVGQSDPLQDVRDYLKAQFAIELRNLDVEAGSASTQLRGVAQRLWSGARERRDDVDEVTRLSLVDHDVENAIGVMQLRSQSVRTPMGYRHWYLTLDHAAFRLREELKREFGPHAPQSPVLSPDILSMYLRLGRIRSSIERGLSTNLPLLTDVARQDLLTDSIVEAADQIRAENRDLPDHVVARRVRDQLNDHRVARAAEAMRGHETEQRIIALAGRQGRRLTQQ